MQLHKRINSEKLRESCRLCISADKGISLYSHDSPLHSYYYPQQSSILVLRQYLQPSKRYFHNFVLL